jgi:hypothetical protein
MRPFGADLERFAARRLMRGALIAALLLIVVVIGVQTVRGHQFVKRYESQMYSDGSFDPVSGELSPSATPTIQVYTEPHDSRINVARTLSNTLTTSGILLMIVAFVLGASFVGAEFGGSGLSTQLLYEPRRWRVHASKAVAVAVSCAAFALCVRCTIALATFLGGKLHGVVSGGTRHSGRTARATSSAASPPRAARERWPTQSRSRSGAPRSPSSYSWPRSRSSATWTTAAR